MRAIIFPLMEICRSTKFLSMQEISRSDKSIKMLISFHRNWQQIKTVHFGLKIPTNNRIDLIDGEDLIVRIDQRFMCIQSYKS
jgi:hypothetical protein